MCRDIWVGYESRGHRCHCDEEGGAEILSKTGDESGCCLEGYDFFDV